MDALMCLRKRRHISEEVKMENIFSFTKLVFFSFSFSFVFSLVAFTGDITDTKVVLHREEEEEGKEKVDPTILYGCEVQVLKV